MLMIVYAISSPTPNKNCDFAAQAVTERRSSVLRLTTVCPTVDMETHQYSTPAPFAKKKTEKNEMMAMSFNENNYSVNYLIWDQETIESTLEQ